MGGMTRRLPLGRSTDFQTERAIPQRNGLPRESVLCLRESPFPSARPGPDRLLGRHKGIHTLSRRNMLSLALTSIIHNSKLESRLGKE